MWPFSKKHEESVSVNVKQLRATLAALKQREPLEPKRQINSDFLFCSDIEGRSNFGIDPSPHSNVWYISFRNKNGTKEYIEDTNHFSRKREFSSAENARTALDWAMYFRLLGEHRKKVEVFETAIWKATAKSEEYRYGD